MALVALMINKDLARILEKYLLSRPKKWHSIGTGDEIGIRSLNMAWLVSY
jgi:hypothetical protein